MDYSKYKEINLFYGGTSKKSCILINGKRHVMKFQKTNKDGVKLFNHISEYIVANICKMCGISTISPILGTYKGNNIVVYEDPTPKGNLYLPFKAFLEKKYDLSKDFGRYNFDNIYLAINFLDEIKNKEETFLSFWKTFIIDALCGNGGRDMVSWGFNIKNDKHSVCPMHNFGFSLCYDLPESRVVELIKKHTLPDSMIFGKESFIHLYEDDRGFFSILTSNEFEELDLAFQEIFPKINLERINKMIDDIHTISNERKAFLKMYIKERYTKIILEAYKGKEYGKNY